MTPAQLLQIFDLRRHGLTNPIIAHTLGVSILDIRDLGPASWYRIEMPKDNSWSRTVREILRSLAQ